MIVDAEDISNRPCKLPSIQGEACCLVTGEIDRIAFTRVISAHGPNAPIGVLDDLAGTSVTARRRAIYLSGNEPGCRQIPGNQRPIIL